MKKTTKKKQSRQKRTKPKSSKSRGNSKSPLKISDQRKPFIFERVAAGLGCPAIAKEFGVEYELIDQATINHFLRDHPEEYKEWRDKNFKEDVRLADRKARLVSLQRVADRIRVKVEEALSEETGKILSLADLDKTSTGMLLREYREYIDQIRDESGDKKSGAGQGTEDEPFVLKVISHVPGE